MLHQFLFWSIQKKAVPLQRISKQKYAYETDTTSLPIFIALVWKYLDDVNLMFS